MVGDFGQSGGVTNLAMLKVIGSIGPAPATDLAGDNFGVGGEADFGDITARNAYICGKTIGELFCSIKKL